MVLTCGRTWLNVFFNSDKICVVSHMSDCTSNYRQPSIQTLRSPSLPPEAFGLFLCWVFSSPLTLDKGEPLQSKLDQVLIKMSLIVFEGLAEKWFFNKLLLIRFRCWKKNTQKTQEQWLCYSILIKDEILGQFSFKCCSQAHLCLFLS